MVCLKAFPDISGRIFLILFDKFQWVIEAINHCPGFQAG